MSMTPIVHLCPQCGTNILPVNSERPTHQCVCGAFPMLPEKSNDRDALPQAREGVAMSEDRDTGPTSPASAHEADGVSPKGCDTASHAPADSALPADVAALEPAEAQRDDVGKFLPGHEKVGGREKGTPNRFDHRTKKLMHELVEHGLEDAKEVYDRVKKGQPRAALTILAKFAEFERPKLQRTEVVGEDGGPVIIEKRIHDSSDKDKE